MADKNIEIGLEVADASLVAGMDKAAAKASEAGAKIQQGLERAAGGAKSLARELDRATTAGKNLQAAQKGFNWSGVASVASSAAGFGMMAVGSRLAASKDEDKQRLGGALQGAGPGVGLGASIGTMIAPGVGTAIGAAAGALAGAASGMLNAGAKLREAAEAQKEAARKEKEDLVAGFHRTLAAEARAAGLEDFAGRVEGMGIYDVEQEIKRRESERRELRQGITSRASISAAGGQDATASAGVVRAQIADYARLGDELKMLERRLANLHAEQERAELERIEAEDKAREEAHRAELARLDAVREHEERVEATRASILAEWREMDAEAAKNADEAAKRLRETIESTQRSRMDGFSSSMKSGVSGAVSNDLTRIGGGVEGLSGSTFGGLLREANVIARQSLDQLKRINNVGGGGTAVAVWGA